MLPLLVDLFLHQAWADAAILTAVRNHPGAADDQEIRTLLHHIATVQHYFLACLRREPFDAAAAQEVPESLDTIEALFHRAHSEQLALLESIAQDELDEIRESPFRKDIRLSGAEMLMQVLLHSQGHRAQCAMLLRKRGGSPPVLDFILWLKERPVPVYGQGSKPAT